MNSFLFIRNIYDVSFIYASLYIISRLPVCPHIILLLCNQEEPDLKRKELPETDSTELYFYLEFAPAVVNEDAMAFVVDTASNSNKSL